jgi:transcriptional regulator with XRE-family HTH domain
MDQPVPTSIDLRLARRLQALRAEHGWSLDELASRAAVSRATLSRLENAEVSPTAHVLGKLCAAYGLTMSRLMYLVEDAFVALIPEDRQTVWVDPSNGFHRRSVSPVAQALTGEVIEGTLKPGTQIAYDRPSRQGLEHHLVLIEGVLAVTIDGETHRLQPGDCLRYLLAGASAFSTPARCGARYLLFMV